MSIKTKWYVSAVYLSLFIFGVSNCNQSNMEPKLQREACYAEAHNKFQSRAEACSTSRCIDLEAEQWKKEQESCP